MTRFMGIDGGGSTLRVAIIDEHANIITEVTEDTANPNLIGRDVASSHIQGAMRQALAQVDSVAGVGIGIAGASAEYAEDWLRAVINGVLPDVHIAPASDNEIALVGALGKREGVLVLSGTGSGSFGINADGEKLQVGGWGYLLGDEGSGYWIGSQALKYATQCYDRAQSSEFYQAILSKLGASTGRGIIEAIYLVDKPVPTIASLTPTVLSFADHDVDARAIVDGAIQGLVHQVQIVIDRLQITNPKMAFAGSIIEKDTPVRSGLAQALGLDMPPQALYRPVVGAALLAQLILKDRQT